MNYRVLVASAFALSIMTPVAALALTIDNQDKASHTLKVTPAGGKERSLAVKASGHTNFDCKAGATIMLDGSSVSCSAKTEKISIKSGKLVM